MLNQTNISSRKNAILWKLLKCESIIAIIDLAFWESEDLLKVLFYLNINFVIHMGCLKGKLSIFTQNSKNSYHRNDKTLIKVVSFHNFIGIVVWLIHGKLVRKADTDKLWTSKLHWSQSRIWIRRETFFIFWLCLYYSLHDVWLAVLLWKMKVTNSNTKFLSLFISLVTRVVSKMKTIC